MTKIKKIKLDIAKIVGTPGASSWSQIHTFTPEDPQKLALRGRLLAVISLKSVEAGIEAVALGREILARLHEEYFGNLEGGILKRLKGSLGKIHQEWPKVEIAAGAVFSSEKASTLSADVLYLAILGKGKAVLKRGNQLQTILEGAGEDQIETGSGFVQAGDTFLIGSESFFEIVGEGVLKASLGAGTPQEMGETIAPIVLGRSDLLQAAAVIASLSFEQTEEELIPFAAEEGIRQEEPPPLKKPLFNRISAGMSFLISKVKFPKRRESSFYLRGEGKNNKAVLSIAIILILLFLGSLILGNVKKKKAEREDKIRALFSQAESLYNGAKQEMELDSESARVTLQEAKNLLEEAQKLNPKSTQDVDYLLEEVKKFLTKTDKDIELGELPVFFDLGLIVSGAKASGIALLGNQLAVLDSEKNTIYLIDLEKKSSLSIQNESLAKVVSIFSSEEEVFVFTDEGIFQSDFETKKLNLIVKIKEPFSEIISGSFFNGNFYLLDKKEKMIWQYLRAENGFSGPLAWAEKETFAQMEPISMAVDGSIWVLGEEGKIYQLLRGRKSSFALKGFKEEQSKNFNLFFTSQTASDLFFVNGEEKKMVVFSKDGQFKIQYLWEGKLEQPDFLVASEIIKKAILVQDNLIFTIPLSDTLQ